MSLIMKGYGAILTVAMFEFNERGCTEAEGV
jgi:hypothetical protein